MIMAWARSVACRFVHHYPISGFFVLWRMMEIWKGGYSVAKETAIFADELRRDNPVRLDEMTRFEELISCSIEYLQKTAIAERFVGLYRRSLMASQ
jgi:hypothetical protein